MADIPSNISKMNDLEVAFEGSLSEQLINKLAANINGLIDLSGNFVEFLSDGTLDVPEGITRILALGCAGGGGGAGAGVVGGALPLYAAQGGSSSLLTLNVYEVTPLETLTVTIGLGGSGGPGSAGITATNGSSGTNTTLSGNAGTLTWLGARGGFTTGNSATSGFADYFTFYQRIQNQAFSQAYGQFVFTEGASVTQLNISQASDNYTSTIVPNSILNGGSGGPSSFGPGGDGGIGLSAPGAAAPSDSRGAGGGGGGRQAAGGAGANGALYLFW